MQFVIEDLRRQRIAQETPNFAKPCKRNLFKSLLIFRINRLRNPNKYQRYLCCLNRLSSELSIMIRGDGWIAKASVKRTLRL